MDRIPSSRQRYESEAVLKVFFGENGTRDELLANRASPRRRTRRTAHWQEVADRYDAGEGEYPERFGLSGLVARLLGEQQAVTARWGHRPKRSSPGTTTCRTATFPGASRASGTRDSRFRSPRIPSPPATTAYRIPARILRSRPAQRRADEFPAVRRSKLVMGAGTHTVAFAVRGPISQSDLQGLCDRVCAVLRQSAAPRALCDVATVGPDAVTVEALARLQLAARRLGCQVHLENASPELVDLVSFMGLEDVLPAKDQPRGMTASDS